MARLNQIIVLLLNKKLYLFNVKLSTDVVCSTTDGVSVMEKMDNESLADYQLCFAHSIQLAVVDVIHKKISGIINQNVNEEYLDDDSDEIFDIFTDDNKDENEVIEQALNLLPVLLKVLVKDRKIVVAFKR